MSLTWRERTRRPEGAGSAEGAGAEAVDQRERRRAHAGAAAREGRQGAAGEDRQEGRAGRARGRRRRKEEKRREEIVLGSDSNAALDLFPFRRMDLLYCTTMFLLGRRGVLLM